MEAVVGESIGHYEVTSLLGEGGMGQVYRARDTKLDREVALKVLPEELSEDPDTLARFQREAHLLAALNHPRIGAIYGIEETRSSLVLVLELVEGQTLAELIEGGPVPLQESLKLTLQISEALDAAHRRGIIHRDLKPANVKITPEGEVKVLDFGLAKSLIRAPQASVESGADTILAPQQGVILGTTAYMSPEQVRGQPADERSDVWALGAVLFQMLSAEQPFEAETVGDLFARILTEDPDWSKLPEDTPGRIRHLIHRCLCKDRTRRLAAASEAIVAVEAFLADPTSARSKEQGSSLSPTTKAAQRALPWAMTALLGVALILVLWSPWQRNQVRPVVRTDLRIPVPLGTNDGAAVIISSESNKVVFRADPSPLYVRDMDSLELERLPETEGARDPFFSPDGRWVAFFSNDTLQKISLDGGPPLSVAHAVKSPRGGSWGDDGTIVFSPRLNGPIFRISENGGEIQPVTELREGEGSHRWPYFLPGSKAFLMGVESGANSFAEQGRIEAVRLADGERKLLFEGGYYPKYVPTGHIVFFKGGTLYAAPFDSEELEILGSPLPVIEGVLGNTAFSGGGQIAFSNRGDLVYLTATVRRSETTRLVWREASGLSTSFQGPARVQANPRISPDGESLAIEVRDGDQTDIWIDDLKGLSRSQLTFDPGRDTAALWSPDGQSLYFASDRNGALDVYRKRVDGTGGVIRLTDGKSHQFPTTISPDGELLIYSENNEESTGWDLFVLSLEGLEARPFLNTPADEYYATFSPDGRWVAFVSGESGRSKVYVSPFPSGAGKWLVSPESGFWPMWSPRDQKLIFISRETVQFAEYETVGDAFRSRPPQPLFRWLANSLVTRNIEIAPDRERFIVLEPDQIEPSRLIWVDNWFDELRRLVP